MIIRIREPFWLAWERYGWERGTWGVGLGKDKIDLGVQFNQTIEVKVGKKRYKVQARCVQEYSRSHGTEYTAKGIKLYEIPNTLLEKL